jgi:parvulin-like peptidyl-prolyl isomerase
VLLKFLKDPLAHFLALGLGLFLLYAALNPGGGTLDDPKTIAVDRDALLAFVQYRTKTFQPKLAAARLDAMPKEKLKRLIDDYVREEALHREALALGLGRNDYVIKRRMIQKIDFITQGFAEAVIKLSENDIKAHYEANKERYREQAIITFTHVFFDTERHKPDEAAALAKAKLAELKAGPAPFSDAPKHGARFPYGVNYVERTRDQVESYFGKPMTRALFELEPDDSAWRGPFLSPYGAHLVMVVGKKEARIPPLEEMRERVEADLTSERRKEQSEKAIKAIVDSYRIEIDLKGKDAGDVSGPGKRK